MRRFQTILAHKALTEKSSASYLLNNCFSYISPADSARKTITLQLQYGPNLSCPETQRAPENRSLYHLSCQILSYPAVPRENVTWELRDPQFLPFPHEDLLKNVLYEQFNDHVQGRGLKKYVVLIDELRIILLFGGVLSQHTSERTRYQAVLY